MYSHYNPNPKGNRVGDCVVRAVSKALNMSWEDAYIELTIQGYIMGDLLSSNSVWGAFLKGKGFSKDIVSEDCPDCYTLEDFAEEHSEGIYVIGTGSHAVCINNGTIYDAWDSSHEQPIYFYYKGEVNNVRTE
jgi:hypothetical protein